MSDPTSPRVLRIPRPGVPAWEPIDAKTPTDVVGNETGLRLAADPAGAFALTAADGSLGRLTLPRNLAVCPDLRVYLLDPAAGTISVYDPDQPRADATRPFAPIPAVGNHPLSGRETDNPRRFVRATAIAVDADTLYVADGGSRRILAFALKSWALRAVWTLAWPDSPADLAVRHGRLYVLSGYALHAIDVTCPNPVLLHRRYNGGPPWDRLALDRRGWLYVLEQPIPELANIGQKSELLVFDPRHAFEIVDHVTEAAAVRDRFPLPALFSVPADAGERQYVVPGSLIRACDRAWPTLPPGESIEAYLTRPLAAGGFVFDALGRRVPPERVRFPQSRFFRTGQGPIARPWVSRALDSGLFNCRWDRLVVSLQELPPGTLVELSTWTDNDPTADPIAAGVPDEAWAVGLTVTGPPADPTAKRERETDFPVDSPPGRYLWVRVRLQSDGFSTPVLSGLVAHFPRQSYLEHLPAVFSEDEAGRRFLERFLSIFQAEWDQLDERITNAAELFDPKAAPDGQVDALAGWLGVVFENGLPVAARRRLLARMPAATFAPRHADGQPGGARRGTPAAIRETVAAVLAAVGGVEPTATGFPHVIDEYRSRDYRLLPSCRDGRGAELADANELAGPAPGRPLWGPQTVGRFQLGVSSRLEEDRLLPAGSPDLDVFAVHAHRFRVVIPASWVATPRVEASIRRSIEAEQPAHTQYELQLVAPGFRVGVQSTLGVDTILGGADARPAALGRLNADAVLAAGERPEPGLDRGLRLGTDSPRM